MITEKIEQFLQAAVDRDKDMRTAHKVISNNIFSREVALEVYNISEEEYDNYVSKFEEKN